MIFGDVLHGTVNHHETDPIFKKGGHPCLVYILGFVFIGDFLHHFAPPFVRICLELFPSIKQANPSEWSNEEVAFLAPENEYEKIVWRTHSGLWNVVADLIWLYWRSDFLGGVGWGGWTAITNLRSDSWQMMGDKWRVCLRNQTPWDAKVDLGFG